MRRTRLAELSVGLVEDLHCQPAHNGRRPEGFSADYQIAVVIINSLQDYPIEEVSLAILRNWGVGGKEHNNGIVFG